MLKWTLIFFAFSLVAGVLGFSGIAVTSSSIAQILFYIFIILFVVSLIFRGANGIAKS